MNPSKPKISTKTKTSALERQNKILDKLKTYPEGRTPKYLSSDTGINANTVKSILKRLEIKTLIRKKEGLRGFYELVDNSNHGVIFDWNFHNTILSYNLPDYQGEAVKQTFNFGTIKYEFSIGKVSKKASLRIITNYPINISSISVCFSYFSLLLSQYIMDSIKEEDIMVSCMEFNKDYISLRLDGAKCITLTELIGQFKVYQKKNCLREEHKIDVPIKAESIFSLLNNQIPNLSVLESLSSIKHKQEEQENALTKINLVLSKFLEIITKEVKNGENNTTKGHKAIL